MERGIIHIQHGQVGNSVRPRRPSLLPHKSVRVLSAIATLAQMFVFAQALRQVYEQEASIKWALCLC